MSGLAGGGFVLASVMPGSLLAEEAPSLVGSVELNAYVQIDEDGTITIYSGSPEMGQGIKTSLPMIVAEEMGANWDDVIVKQTPEVDTERYGRQSTGGSYTLYLNWNLMRKMGATAREMFLAAGAIEMELPRDELKVENSRVFHIHSDQFRSFAELAALAYRQPVPDPESLVYKGREEYTILGKSVSQVDSLDIVTGAGDFGIDTRVPDMLYGTYEKCPAVGGTIVSANLDDLKKEPGVVDAWIINGNGNVRELMDGVGIVGTSTWAVFKAREKLKVVWDESAASKDSWTGFKKFAEDVDSDVGPEVNIERGDFKAVFEDRDNRVVERFYEFPYVTHMCLEPMNCTAHYRAGEKDGRDHLEVWLPTQNGPRFQSVAKNLYGLEKDQVTIHVKRMGGSFGRRTSNEYVCEAIELSKRAGKPVKLTWSREDNMRHDFFRVGGFQKVRAAVNPEGRVVGWDEHAIGIHQNGERVVGSGFRDSAFPLANFPVVRGSHTTTEMKTLAGPWRAPWSNTHAFITQSFIHELAVETGRDHVELLLEMLGSPRKLPGDIRSMHTGRAADVIKMVASKGGWGRKMPKGRGLGLSFYFCHAAHVAEIAEVSVDAERKLTLHRVTAAVDVGPIINMSGALGQVQGAIIDGYSTMVGQKITMEQGRIEQTNLDQYPVLRIGAAPEVDVHFIQSDNEPTGLGEPALPPLAAAVANAIYAATGERVRKMPLIDEGFTV
ncbi:MAG: xanthine dehydrogenase family protein molybdopterin-binding subunit [Gammaproteobacteria bacterium]|nr:xanthine dehydrogenase family protein molybdopterin-binding subunit [Gammaproteobacteria bacterium]